MLYKNINFKKTMVEITLNDNSIVKGEYDGYNDDVVLELENATIIMNDKTENCGRIFIYKDEIVDFKRI